MACASAALVVMAALAAACGDGGTEPPPPDPPRPATVTVTPATVQITALGATVQLAADVRDQHGQVMAGATVNWSSSTAAVVTVDASGLVTAAGNGMATITASAGSASGMAAVSVMQSPDSVAVLPAEATIAALGDTLRLAAEAFDANRHAVAGADFAWESTDGAVATVEGSGLVTAVGNGTATITASAGSASGMAAVTVMQVPDSVAVLPAEATIAALGDTLRLAAEAFDGNGHAVADAEFSWESSDGAVATVDGSGLVTAAGNGRARVTATAGEVSGAATVTVREPGTLFGTVSDSRKAGLAIPGATVQVENGTTMSMATDSLGRFLFSGISGQSVTVTVSAARSYQPLTVEVAADSGPLDIELAHTGISPFFGTLWITPDILGPDDPTSFGSVTYTGRGARQIFDRRADGWITVERIPVRRAVRRGHSGVAVQSGIRQ